MSFLSKLVGLALCMTPLLSNALPTLEPRDTASICPKVVFLDAPYSLPCSTYTSAVTCPRGIQGKSGGIVFLVHGTGSTGSESWANGPYNLILPTMGPSYDICWVDLPGRALVDAQLSAEYVAYNVHYLAAKSATGQVAIIGHSQGAGLNPQWALDFWPSTRFLVSDYVALAPDFHGTTVTSVLCSAETGCAAGVWQQAVDSHYIAAQNTFGGFALVPTTAIYTTQDQIVQPETTNPSSYLFGASVIPLQSASVCGPSHNASHFDMIVDPAAFALAYDALTHIGGASVSRFQKANCAYTGANAAYISSFAAAANASGDADLAAMASATMLKAEPLLKAYVCKRWDALSYCESA